MTNKRISFRATARLLLAGRFTVVCYVLHCSRWGHEAMLTPYQPQLTQHARNGSKRVCGQRIQTVLDIRSFSARSCIRVSWHFSLDRTLVHPLSTWQCNSVRPWALRSRTSLDISPYSHRPHCAGDLTPERCYAKACSTPSPIVWALNHLISRRSTGSSVGLQQLDIGNASETNF